MTSEELIALLNKLPAGSKFTVEYTKSFDDQETMAVDRFVAGHPAQTRINRNNTVPIYNISLIQIEDQYYTLENQERPRIATK